jgi:hypothetical protein
VFTLEKFTIAAWVKSPGTNGNWQGIVGKWDAANGNLRNYGLWLHQNDCTLGVQSYGAPNVDIWPAAPNLCDKKWRHIVGTCDGSKVLAYVDGVNVGEATVGKLSTTNDPVRIGRGPWGGHYSTAEIDEVAIYNNALNEKELSDLMNKGIKPTAVGLSGKLAATWGQIKK